MSQLEQTIYELEIQIWEAAKNQNTTAYMELVSEDAVMVCGGYRCTGKEYAAFIKDFDIASYEVKNYETIVDKEELVQNHYICETKVKMQENKDLEGIFHITSTWQKRDGLWKLIYNMDSRILG